MTSVSRIKPLLAKLMMEAILVAMCVVLAFKAPNFMSTDNFLVVLRQIAMQGLIAFGMTMVIIAGEIDLSVGSVAAFAGCFLAYLCKIGVPIPLGIPATLVIGAACGAITGIMRVKFEVPSFITTLALFTALKGFSLMLTNGFPITSFPAWFGWVGTGYIFGIPFCGFVFLVIFAIAYFIMKYTPFGASIYAVGGNAEAARLSGIPVSLVRLAVFMITSGLAALSGILLSARIMSGTPTVAQGWELDAIAAAIIGGTSFTGGVGTIRGTLTGIIFIGVLSDGMTLLDVNPYVQYVIRGGVILAAVLANQMQDTRSKAA